MGKKPCGRFAPSGLEGRPKLGGTPFGDFAPGKSAQECHALAHKCALTAFLDQKGPGVPPMLQSVAVPLWCPSAKALPPPGHEPPPLIVSKKWVSLVLKNYAAQKGAGGKEYFAQECCVKENVPPTPPL